MKAIILLATLKKEGMSNTEVLSQFLADKFKKKNVDSEIVKLVDYKILPGTYSDMGNGDQWPEILAKILSAEIIIFATPIWWNNQSSEMQRVIERLDVIHDGILSGEVSKLENKTGGIVVTGDSDGSQHLIGNISNFFNAIGVILPPYSTLTVLWEGQAKDKSPTKEELLKKYNKDYGAAAEKMVDQLIKYSIKK
ncbi:MAG: hypothetical protein NVSMB66_4580 [Candidatus Doudnabacteria bacterium]